MASGITYLSVQNLAKRYGEETLFEGLTFGVSRGDKTALVAENGTGKSTLLKIVAGIETADGGEVMLKNGLKIGYLPQDPTLNPEQSIEEYISDANTEIINVIKRYEAAVHAQAEDYNEETHEAFDKATQAMHRLEAWDYENRMKEILSKLDIHRLDQQIESLSGGERKRVALAFALLDDPDLLILDEPTNHLDLDMIEWLEKYLQKSTMSLLMVTHDRYFLDRICDHIIELDDDTLYHHKGNYGYFLMKRAERKQVEASTMNKKEQLFKKELNWMRKSPRARTTKSKARIQDFYQVQDDVMGQEEEQEIDFAINMSRMGNKILEVQNVSKSYGDLVILDDFDYTFQAGERIGIIGKNGAGKSTFLNVITGAESFESGEIDTGETIVYGHYKQQGIDADDDMRAIEVVKEVAEYIEMSDGNKLSASGFLEHFMFTRDMQYTPVGKLSGGERRRLGLMMTLIQNPNFLILDEPTNDLDLVTLNKLEEFLMNFKGCLIIVSHDRFFMDKLVDHYFVFEGNGVINDHIGTYSEYRDKKIREEAELREQKAKKREAKSGVPKSVPAKPKSKSGLTHKERKEYQKLEKGIQKLEEEKKALEKKMASGDLDTDEVHKTSLKYGELESEIEEKELRWMELAEKEES